MTYSTFAIDTEKFQGPIELLLDLIERQKLHISEVSLSKVADDFIAYIERVGELPISDTANFVYVASILLLIKSKSLLPGLELTEEENSDISDLERRLAILKLLKEQAKVIESIYGKEIIFSREGGAQSMIVFAPAPNVTSLDLQQAILDIIKRTPIKEQLSEKTIRKVVSLDDMINKLHSRISSALSMSFREFSGLGKEERVAVVVSFLAMLELVKRGVVMVSQSDMFEDIQMETINTGTPTYNIYE